MMVAPRTQTSEICFRLSVNDLFPGEKIIQGDNRHAEYHGAFQPGTHIWPTSEAFSLVSSWRSPLWYQLKLWL
jgi:hypothetical protein